MIKNFWLQIAVGSYDHDSFSYLGVVETNSDCVRCICGTTDDDGPMIQCEKCNFWLHEECVFDEKPSSGVKVKFCNSINVFECWTFKQF